MKVEMIGLLVLTLVSVSLAEGCYKYSCKWWFESMDEDLCVKVNLEFGSRQLMKNCDDGKVCEANEWRDADYIKNDAKCKDPADDPTTNTKLPGEYCTKDSDCFKDIHITSCDSGVCKMPGYPDHFCPYNNLDSEINRDWYCPVGYYCSPWQMCAEQLKEGDRCFSGRECTSGYNCVMVNNTGFRCTKLWSLNEGDKFDYIRATAKDPVLQFQSLCKSNWAMLVYPDSQTYECRRAPYSKKANKLSDLKKGWLTDGICRSYYYDGKNDISEPQPYIDDPRCGFNKDSSRYCDKLTGDKWFQSVLKEVQETDYSSIVCHVNSTLSECANFNEVIPKDLYKKFFREFVSTSDGRKYLDGGYAFFANNDECVAASITSWFWQGDKPYSESDTETVVAAEV